MGLYKHRSLLKLNMKMLLDYEFVRDGRYSNVASGQQYYDGSDMSILQCDTEASNQFGMQAGQVWQSISRNWVYESGVVLNDTIGIRDNALPIVCSGVYVDGIFKATASSHPDHDVSYSHHVDWINGRVIFDSPVSLTSNVQAAFAYKHVRVTFEDDFNNELQQGYLESKYLTNPLVSNNLAYPSGMAQPFPAVFVETASRRWKPYELGNRSLTAHDRVIFHVWTLDGMTRDDVMDIISYQERKSIPMIDFNLAPLPLSGIYNEISPEYIPYQELLKNPVVNVIGSTYGTAHAIGYNMFIEDTESMNDARYADFERGRVECIAIVHQFHPNLPIGINTGSFGFKGGNENF